MTILADPVVHTDSRMVFVAAADACVLRALERAGNMLQRRDRSCHGLAPHEVHLTVPADPEHVAGLTKRAWDHLGPLIAVYGCCGMEPTAITSALDIYVCGLLVNGEAHSAHRMVSALEEACPAVFCGLLDC